MLGAVSTFVARAVEKLRRQGNLTHVLTVFLSKNRFGPDAGEHSHSAVLTLPLPSSDTRELAGRAAQMLCRLWEPGAVYVKAGVVLAGLEVPSGQQLGLFGGTVQLAALGPVGGGPVPWQGRQPGAPQLTPRDWRTCRWSTDFVQIVLDRIPFSFPFRFNRPFF